MPARRVPVLSLAFAILLACTSGASPASPTATTVAAPAAPDQTGPATSTTLPSPAAEPNQDILTIVPGVLTVGTEALVSPWYVGSTPPTVTAGFEYDLAKALAARLNVSSVRVVLTPLVTLLSGQDCKCDLMLNEVLVTDNRARSADLTEPYLTVDQAVLVRAGVSMANIAEGRTFRWGVALKNSAGLDVIAQRIKPITPPEVLVDETDGIQRVADGRLDAMITQTPTAVSAAENNPALEVAGQMRTGELYAGALTLGSPNTAALNDAIRNMRDDGTISLFLRQYFGGNPADVPEIPS
ncbi:MAG TPA: transporter substrate-binding domain-containing protein [Acidimicrobiales bacterium]|jgi:cystine transport system substrate-binding protein|nr:transporter substrate-binding domain-containing protein [Acidimicrobiales bacterium]